MYVHYIVIGKQDNTCYMYGSLPSARTPTDFMYNQISFPLPTLILIIVLCYIIYIASLIKCIQPDDGHSSIGRNM